MKLRQSMRSHCAGIALLTAGILMGCSEAPQGGESIGVAGRALELEASTEFYTPIINTSNHGAIEQIADLTSSGDHENAALIRKMTETPQAVWLERGTPKKVKQQARQISQQAAGKGEVPVFVAYNIPFRDCAQFSAGGATSKEAYLAWIDGVAAGISDNPALVILEPDGLGIIPHYTALNGDEEWCKPDEADPETAVDDRFEMLNYAVDALKALPNAKVYLDGTHSSWLGTGEIAHRLVLAGVERADGFFLNASNYQITENLVQYGTWISKCIATSTFGDACASQWWNGGPEGTKIAELMPNGAWDGIALSPHDVWSDDSDDPALNTSGINARLDWMQASIPFVIDTSRNGVGPWTIDHEGDIQDWCNPPDRGLGLRPTADTGNSLVDAYLWIKIPGESDGECNRWEAPGSDDPVRGYMDPGAGEWFPEQALELVQFANPAL